MGWQLAGKSLFYMQFLHPNIDWGVQKERIHGLCYELVSLRRYVLPRTTDASDKGRQIMLKWLARFSEEVENQC